VDDVFAIVETAKEVCMAELPLDVVIVGTAADIFATFPECDGVSSESEPLATLIPIGNEGTVVLWMTAVVLNAELACVVIITLDETERGSNSFVVALILRSVAGEISGEIKLVVLKLWVTVEIVLAGKENRLDSNETGHR